MNPLETDRFTVLGKKNVFTTLKHTRVCGPESVAVIQHDSRFIAGGLGQKNCLSMESTVLPPGTTTFNKRGYFLLDRGY